MEEVNFELNNKLEVISNDKACKSDIQDVKEKSLLISIPMYEGHYVPFVKGEKIECLYFSEEYIFKFKSTVLGRIEQGIQLLVIEKPEPQNIIRVQRRNYVRVSMVKEIKCSKFSLDLISKTKKNSEDEYKGLNGIIIDENKLNKCLLLDMSGGGMRIKTKETVNHGDLMVALLSLDSGELVVTAKVVRKQKTEEKDYIYGLTFTDVADRDRERIIKYIFTVMRDQRKKS